MIKSKVCLKGLRGPQKMLELVEVDVKSGSVVIVFIVCAVVYFIMVVVDVLVFVAV